MKDSRSSGKQLQMLGPSLGFVAWHELAVTPSFVEPARRSPGRFVSVVVRSFGRPEALKELIERLQTQSCPAFEAVILEQSNDRALLQYIEKLGDARLRVVQSPPLNPAAARNEAIRHTRGDILLFIDDDDLPLGNDWIESHLRNYEDASCMGVVGRLLRDPGSPAPPSFPRFVRFMAMRHTFFKDSRALAHNTLRKRGIDFLLGSNSSVRCALLDRIGGWDEGIPINEEQSFAIKFHRNKKAGEHLVFDPAPGIWRRTDVPGGLNRRFGRDWYLRELDAWLFYFRHIVAHYFPWRYRLLYPFFVLRALQKVTFWIWDVDNAHHPFRERVVATLKLVTQLPGTLANSRYPAAAVRRVPQWV